MAKFYKLEEIHAQCIKMLAQYANQGVGSNDVERAFNPLRKVLNESYSYEDVEKEHEKIKKEKEKKEKEDKESKKDSK